jgi:hypothetical protein
MSIFDGPRQILHDMRARPLEMALLLLLAAGGVFLTGYLQEKGKRAAESNAAPAAQPAAPPIDAATAQPESEAERETQSAPEAGTRPLPPAEVPRLEMTLANKKTDLPLPEENISASEPFPGNAVAQPAGPPVAAVAPPYPAASVAQPLIPPLVLILLTVGAIIGFVLFLNRPRKKH